MLGISMTTQFSIQIGLLIALISSGFSVGVFYAFSIANGKKIDRLLEDVSENILETGKIQTDVNTIKNDIGKIEQRLLFVERMSNDKKNT